LIVDEVGRVWCLSITDEGRCHDKRLADSEPYDLPAGSSLYQDMGFQGFAIDDIIIIQPKKKPRGGELTAEEKEENRRINSIRVLIEHVISSVKRYRIVKEKLRLWREHVQDMVMETCCGLHNFRLRFRPWSRKASNES
jgi:DDE superfamily endonuclease